jgi:ABC-2 type transport system ATP-binding protein
MDGGMNTDADTDTDTDTEMGAIESIGLTKEYGDTVAVNGIDLSVPEGTVYGLLGPNGSGKTTTMRMLTTLTEPTSGEAYIMGDSVEDREAVIEHVGYLSEESPLYDELTAREQLEYIADLRDVPEEVAQERIEDYLSRFGLSEEADDRISTYSKGMRRKTSITQTVLHDPDVAFFDEPTSGLDPRAARTVRELIEELSDEDMTIFLSTHILPVVESVSDVVGVLYEGSLVAEGTPDELKDGAETGTLEDVFIEVTTDRGMDGSGRRGGNENEGNKEGVDEEGDEG